jgi:L-seryl-tRNA(Ser) seleniumtransferase
MVVVTPSTSATTLRDLGLRPVINAAATLTKLGGSLMPPEVIAAMVEGARSFVDLPALQGAVAARIAELTRNEAAYISSGAAGGIVVTVASLIAGTDPHRIAAFPKLEGIAKKEIIVHRSQRNGYDYAARQTGARFVEIDGTVESLTAVISERTAGVLWFAGSHFAKDALPIETVVEIAHAHGVPVVVDAAAQIPYVANLWHFTQDVGADIAIFSGGKGLCGPQSSGLVLGRAEIIAGCVANGSPNTAIGRPLKVGKEELFGILAAVEWTLNRNEPEVIAWYESVVQTWIEGLSGLPGVTVERGFPNEAGQPFGRVLVTLGPEAATSRDDLVRTLWDGDPRIAVGVVGETAFALNPQTIQESEVQVVLQAVRAALEAR